ncbi:DUF4097 family beta strand repeat-containing protein [Micromonospora sp. NPDC020750]|uniref:DUF4097 family beta strand repeat-containing protein n=1 Tax=unclassified Micromonospora TaxID=2617518 RepID=UPI0037AC9D41
MTSRQHTARQAGPITLDARVTAGNIRVTVENRTHAEITISTADTTGPSADAVNNATINDQGDRITAEVRNSGGGGVVMQSGGVQTNVFRSGGGITVTQVGGNVYGTVVGAVVSGRDIIVNGVHVGGGGGVLVGGSPIVIEARLPVGSSLAADTTSADIDATGPLTRAQIRAVSGDVNLDGVASLDVSTTSGDTTVAAFAGSGQVRAVSGDVRVTAVQESSLQVRTVSGDVRITGARVALDASTVSGRVSQR